MKRKYLEKPGGGICEIQEIAPESETQDTGGETSGTTETPEQTQPGSTENTEEQPAVKEETDSTETEKEACSERTDPSRCRTGRYPDHGTRSRGRRTAGK